MELPTARLRRRLDCRALDEKNVKNLMEKMRKEGFWKSSPLRVRPIKIRELNNGNIDGWEITSGRHRFEAAWRLNFKTAPCVIETEDDLHAELSMIDENLIRAELGPIDLAKQTARRKKIHELLYPDSKASYSGGAFRGNQHEEVALGNIATTFAVDTASKTGRAESTVRKDARRGERISDEVAEKIRGTRLDKGDYLEELQKVPMEDQLEIVEKDLSKKRVVAKPANDSSKRGRPRMEKGPTTRADAAAEYIFANMHADKIPGLIGVIQGTKPKLIIAALRLMLATSK